MDNDTLNPRTRTVLDALDGAGVLLEWHPDKSEGDTVTVVFPDETAARITVTTIPDPGPVDSESTVHAPAGIHWRLGEGHEVQAADEEGVFDNDLDAARALARHTPYRWLLYEEYPGHPWSISAYTSEDAASRELPTAPGYGFVFDGRGEPPVDGPGGIGYRPKLD